MPITDDTCRALVEGRIRDPFAVLGMHQEADGWWVRVWSPGALAVRVVVPGCTPLAVAQRHPAGLFEGRLSGVSTYSRYTLEIARSESGAWETCHDPYGFPPAVPEFDLGLIQAGHHLHLGDILGAHCVTLDGVAGVRFAVWAPAAERVSVIGDWNGFNGLVHPMRMRGTSGIWELFLPGLSAGGRYKYEILTSAGALRIKADPVASQAEMSPATASVIPTPDTYAWQDGSWIEQRGRVDHLARPMAIYEVFLGGFLRGEGADSWPNYRELAKRLVAHVKDLGFTHIELLPVAQFPFEGSWGYQVTGQFAPNARHGSPDDLRWFVDHCHANDIAVLVDFVPGHFPKDDFSLARFDGSACYEYADPREGEHKEWGTHVFNWRRTEVRNFLVAAALHWCRRFHIDGLRIDAVSSMLYRDYGRKQGEWVANDQGSNANFEAVEFLQELTSTVKREFPGVMMIAEESTAWMGVTAPTDWKGLGFDLKWNMGWMHDTLGYLAQDPVMRSGCHNRATFHQWYAYDERWILPLSHDEVVHGKRSLIDKLPGDWWQRRAQLRLLLGYQIAVPGRPLLFMGGEFGQGREFDWQRRLPWDEFAQPERRGITAFLRRALELYRNEPALHVRDDFRDGFQWVDSENSNESVLAFLRKAPGAPDILVACNFTPIARHDYPLGVPRTGPWTILLSSDDPWFGGGGCGNAAEVHAHHPGPQGVPAQLRLNLPPLSIVFLRGPG